jgi:hypothetical protein
MSPGGHDGNLVVGVGFEPTTFRPWFRELQHYGFIVMVTPGVLGVEGKGKAPRWRLTELGYMREPPTHDFRRWMGTNSKRQKQNPCENWRTECAGKPAHQRAGKPHC